jgi:hypothetical protein
VLAFRDGAAFDAISGQEWVFEVARFQREVEAWKRSTAAVRSSQKPRVVRPARSRVHQA